MIQVAASGTPLELVNRRRRGITVTSAGTSSFATAVLGTAGLVSYYRLDESSGTVMTDQTGTNTGSYQGTVTLGVAGATSDGHTGITIPSTSNANFGLCKATKILAGLTNWSILAFVKTTNLGTTGGVGCPIYCERSAAGNDILSVAETTNAGTFNFGYRNDAAVLNTITSTGTINDGNWHMVTVTKSGTAVALYLDGATSGPGGTLTTTDTLTETLSSRIGSDIQGGGFNGSLDEVALFNVALSSGQVSSLYAAR